MSGTSETEPTIVVFQGNKHFFRPKNTVASCTIVDHRDSDITEIICYQASLEMEANRIYMNSQILGTKLDMDHIGKKLLQAKEMKVPNSIRFVNDLVNRATADYVLSRLFIAQISSESQKFEVRIQFNFTDRDLEPDDDSIERLICEKPPDLVPYVVVHNKPPEEVSETKEAPKDNSKEDNSKEGSIPKAPEGSESPAAASTASPSLHSPQLRKRRSYFGSFLASFSLSSDEHAHDAPVRPHSNSEDLQPAQLAQRRAHKLDRQMSIGEALKSFMWHGSDPVVPLNEGEHPVSLATESTDSAAGNETTEVVVAPKHRRTFNIAYQ